MIQSSGGEPSRPAPRPLVVHAAASAELDAAIARYEAQVDGLGAEFLAEVRRASDFLAEWTAAGTPLPGGRRRVLLRRFPFALIYRETASGTIRLLAVAHLRRRPNYWRARR